MRTLLMLFVTSLASFLAAGAGIGGGGILLPIFAILGGYGTRAAVALTNVTVFGGSLGNLCCNFGRRHPKHDGSLIDWDIIVMMEPSTMIGAIVGSYLNAIFPTFLTNVLLALLLTFVNWTLVKRFVKLFRKETQDIASEKLSNQQIPQAQSENSYLSNNGTMNSGNNAKTKSPFAPFSKGCRVVIGKHVTESSLTEPLLLNCSHDATKMEAGSTNNKSKEYMIDGSQVIDQRLCIEATRNLSLTELIDGSDNKGSLVISSSIYDDATTSNLSEAKEGEGKDAKGGDASQKSAREEFKLGGAVDPKSLGSGSFAGFVRMDVEDRSVSISHLLSEAGEAHRAPELDQRRQQFLEERNRRVPASKILILVFLTLWLVVSDELKSNVTCGSFRYWLAVSSIVPPVLLALVLSRDRLINGASLRHELHVPTLEGDIEWNSRNTAIFPALCTGAGIVAGLFGIGGGIVKGPILLELGVLPEVTAATTATMILFTSGTASMVFIRFHYVSYSLSGVALVLGLLSSLSGQVAIAKLIAYLRRRSVIVFVMLVLSVLSMAVMYGRAIHETAVVVRHGLAALAFGSICPKEK
eukprot:CAMPEP_0175043056 /NCGR_PEP_ID=MMETSP0052_2-20121109/2947_1 /TAXON_ID=51329 ORGANISM="Polytomella parva, Strain SAG 63-3" /NCGR_SAMPLE_ID=MMETSP0052_2 /ASSEMBLY_ACC=CAM_ASM_000194 /LENGTH=582 /DNA_ID=CAMNT_0016306017 /DNA_START=154 /DNA_END=1902 /DNA_ORIENTATION=-